MSTWTSLHDIVLWWYATKFLSISLPISGRLETNSLMLDAVEANNTLKAERTRSRSDLGHSSKPSTTTISIKDLSERLFIMESRWSMSGEPFSKQCCSWSSISSGRVSTPRHCLIKDLRIVVAWRDLASSCWIKKKDIGLPLGLWK